MNKLRIWIINLLRCRRRHKHGFEYEDAGGKSCYRGDAECDCSLTRGCSIPVYEVYCKDCGMSWTLGEDELIQFFAKQRKRPEERE
jgi:hypothetical protein